MLVLMRCLGQTDYDFVYSECVKDASNLYRWKVPVPKQGIDCIPDVSAGYVPVKSDGCGKFQVKCYDKI